MVTLPRALDLPLGNRNKIICQLLDGVITVTNSRDKELPKAQPADWLPKFVPIDDNGDVDPRYNNLPDGYETAIGGILIDRRLLSYEDDFWPHFLTGTIEIIPTPLNQEYRIPVVKRNHAFVAKHPVLGSVRYIDLETNKIV